MKCTLEFIGNIFSDENSTEIIKIFAKNNLAGHLGILLDSEHEEIRKSVLWIYSNMVTGPSKPQNEKIIDGFY